MTRVCLKRIETVENIFLGTGKKPPKIGIYSFRIKKSDILGGEFAVKRWNFHQFL